MKMLVAVDGSKQSEKAMEEAAKIAGGCSADQVSLIHVYEKSFNMPMWGEGYNYTREDIERIKDMEQRTRKEREALVARAVDFFRGKNIEAKGMMEEGHPAETIARVVQEEGYDLLVVGSRGLGGLKKLMLGSVSNALLQEVPGNVLVVKQ